AVGSLTAPLVAAVHASAQSPPSQVCPHTAFAQVPNPHWIDVQSSSAQLAPHVSAGSSGSTPHSTKAPVDVYAAPHPTSTAQALAPGVSSPCESTKLPQIICFDQPDVDGKGTSSGAAK